MVKRAELQGVRFGHLIAVEKVYKTNKKGVRVLYWFCECDCGGSKVVLPSNLKQGHTQSCGCLQKKICGDSLRERRFRHGMTKSPEWTSWSCMLQRCYRTKNHNYHLYGGRGVTVCDSWNPDKGGCFENFFSDMGEKPDVSHTLDRIDPHGNYEPENCRWASSKEQSRNRRNTRWVYHKGKKYCLKDFTEKYGLPYESTLIKLIKGYSLEDCM